MICVNVSPQNTVLQDWRLYDTISLRLLELLLSSTTTSLRLTHVRVFFRDAFLGLLHRLTGLQEFTLQVLLRYFQLHLITGNLNVAKLLCLISLPLTVCCCSSQLPDTCFIPVGLGVDTKQTANGLDGRRCKQHDQPTSPHPPPLWPQPPTSNRRLTLSPLTGKFRPPV